MTLSLGLLPLTIRVFTTLQRLVTFWTLDRSDEKAWLDQNIPTYLPTYLPTYQECTSIREHTKGAIIGTCDIWDTDYNTVNWEPGFMTIFVTWQLIVTLDSIRNSCDVFWCLANIDTAKIAFFRSSMGGFDYFPTIYYAKGIIWKKKKLWLRPFNMHKSL